MAVLIAFCPAAAAMPVPPAATPGQTAALVIEAGGETKPVVQALELLKEQGVKAAFFLPGQVLAGEEGLGKAILAGGHDLGNYGFTHAYWADMDSGTIAQDLKAAGEIVARLGGSRRLIRPPYDYDGDNFTRAVAQVQSDAVIIRGIETADWVLTTTGAVVDRVAGRIAPGGVVTVNLASPTATAALPEIIAYLRQQGYTLVRLSDLPGFKPPAAPPVTPPAAKAPAKMPVQPPRSDAPGEWQVLRSRHLPFPAVALTFDDGGTAEQVSSLLDTLRAYQVKSTFFLIGQWMADNPALVQRIQTDGHEIANHSYGHPPFSTLPSSDMKSELGAWNETYRQITGRQGQPYFRPPYGDYNSRVTSVVRETGQEALVLWNVDSRDWTGVDSDAMADQVLAGTDNGSVILFHLHGRHTNAALQRIIPALTHSGYRFVTIGDMLGD